MKRFSLLFAVVCMFCSTVSFSQINVGIKAGANLCNMNFKMKYSNQEKPLTRIKMGAHLGLTADIPLVGNSLSIQPGLLYNNKGYSLDYEEMMEEEFEALGMEVNNFNGHVRLNYNYFEIPVHIAYKKNNLRFFGGPYVAFGIGGSFVHDFIFEADGIYINNENLFDKDSYKLEPVYCEVYNYRYEEYLNDDDVWELYRGFDFGMNLGVGYQVEKVLFSINYSLGLVNLTPKYAADLYNMNEEDTEEVKKRNRVFSFSISYFLK